MTHPWPVTPGRFFSDISCIPLWLRRLEGQEECGSAVILSNYISLPLLSCNNSTCDYSPATKPTKPPECPKCHAFRKKPAEPSALCGTTGIILSIWSQDSRFKAQKKLLQSNLFGFKIQDSRLKAFGFKKFFLDLES